jgi:cobaltochelatase CobN
MNKFALTTKRLVPGHVSVCQGSCCRNTANGKPAVPVEWLKKEWRARGLLKRIQLSISGCLGPCDVPNVVTISNESGTLWLGQITEFIQYRATEFRNA